MIEAALISGRELLSRTLIQAINFHAIACLHAGAGHFRSCAVTVGAYDPPGPERVESMMDDFINMTNLNSKESQVIPLASSVLWAINHIHPYCERKWAYCESDCVLCHMRQTGQAASGSADTAGASP